MKLTAGLAQSPVFGVKDRWLGFALCSVEDISTLRCSKEVRPQRKSQKDNKQPYLCHISFGLLTRASVRAIAEGMDSGVRKEVVLLIYPQRGTGSSDVGGLQTQRWGWTSRGVVVLSESGPWAYDRSSFAIHHCSWYCLYFLFLTGKKDNEASPLKKERKKERMNDIFVCLTPAMLEWQKNTMCTSSSNWNYFGYSRVRVITLLKEEKYTGDVVLCVLNESFEVNHVFRRYLFNSYSINMVSYRRTRAAQCRTPANLLSQIA